MRMVLVVASVAAFGLALAPAGAHAANANNPYGNVDHSNDMGNDTGDSHVEGLNAQQLNENYRGPVEVRPPAGAPMAVPAQPPPPGMPPPPPGATVR